MPRRVSGAAFFVGDYLLFMEKENRSLAALAVVAVILVALGAGFAGSELPRLMRLFGASEPGHRGPEFRIVETYGAQVYRGRCAHCHGADAGGRRGIAPALAGGPLSPSYLTSQRIREAVTSGVARPGSAGMPRIEGLGATEIRALTRYLRSLQEAHR